MVFFLFHSTVTVTSTETLKLSVATPRRLPNKFVSGQLRKIVFSFWKSGVPRPVTGSQPIVAYPNPRGQYDRHSKRKEETETNDRDKDRRRTLKPGVPQPGAFPIVMSLKPAAPFE